MVKAIYHVRMTEQDCSNDEQWLRQLWGTGVRAPSTSNNFICSSLWSKSDSELSKYCAVCKLGWCRCQQLTALLISTTVRTLVTKLLVTEQLLHPALKFAASASWPNLQLFPSSQQILAIAIPLMMTNKNKPTLTSNCLCQKGDLWP